MDNGTDGLRVFVGKLADRCTELEERVNDLENGYDSDGIMDVYPDEDGVFCEDDGSMSLEEYLDAVEEEEGLVEEDDHPHAHLGEGVTDAEDT